MEKKPGRKAKELLSLQARVMELEQQLTEAQATIASLTSAKEANVPRIDSWDSEERFKKAVLALPYPIMIRRDDGQVLLVNTTWTEISGYRLEDIPTLKEWTWKAYGEHWTQQLAFILNQGFSESGSKNWGESEVTIRSGERHIWDFSTAPLGFDEQGRQLVMVVAVDVTERKRAEQALAESERRQREITRLLELDQARLAAVLRNLPVGVWIVDQQGRLTGSNEQADRIWAGETPALNSIEEYDQYVAWYPESKTPLRPEEHPIALALQTGQPVEPMEFKIRRFDGSEGAVLASAAPIKNEQDQLMGAVGVNVDITEHKQVEEALRVARDEAAWLARLPGENPNPVVRTSGTGVVLYCNPPASSLPGWRCTVDEILPTELLPVVQQAMTQGAIVAQDTLLSERFYSVVAVPVLNEGYANLYGIDITERKEAEKALAESTQRINDILNSLGDGLFALDREWSIIYINDKAAQIAGFPADELIGKNLWELWPGLRGTVMEQSYQRAMDERIPGQFRVQGSQTSRWYDVSVYPSSEGITIFYVDKTEEILAEQAVLESEERFSKAFHKAPFGMSITRWQDGAFIDVNAAWLQMLGWTEEEVLGKTTAEIPFYARPEDRQLVRNRIMNDESLSDVELYLVRKDGSGRIMTAATTIIELQGERCILSVLNDITDRKQVEKALRDSEERFRAVVDSALEAIIMSDPSGAGKILSANPAACRMFGYSIDEFLMLDREDILDVSDPRLAVLMEERERLGHATAELTYKRKDGTRFSGELSAAYFQDENGERRSVAIIRDITERKKVEEALRESEQRFNKAFHASPNALVISRQENGQIETVNETFLRLFGYSADEVLRKTSVELGMFVNPADRQEAVRKLRRDGSVRDFELDVRLKSGEIRNASLAVEVIEISSEHMMLTTIQDITLRKRAEAALRESEQSLKHAQEIAHLGSWELDLIHNRLTWSDEVYRIFGLEPQEFGATYEAFLAAVHPEDRAAVDNTYQNSIREGRDTYEIEHRVIKRSNGEIRIVHEKCEHFRNQEGQIIRSVGMVHDITERKQFEIALSKRESILAQAGEIAHLGAWDIEFDRLDDLNANPLAWSDEVYRIFGYAPGEVQPSNELFFERVHPEDRALVQKSIAQALDTRRPYVIEHRIHRPNGEKRIVQEHAEIFFDVVGKPLRIVGAVQDITEQKQAERALRESEERFRSLADSMPQLVWTALPDGTVDYYNQRHLEYHEIKQKEETVWEWAPVLHPDDLQTTVDAWRHAVESGETYQVEHRVRMADGSYRWHLSRGMPMLAENGRILRWFGTATDIHDLKLAEERLKDYAERLERSNRELEQFAFMASHDLQEPLRKIEMFGDLLLERAGCLDDHERNYLERMRNAAGRMRAMVTGLLQLSRVVTQVRPFISVDLTHLTSEVLSDLEGQIRRTGGNVEVEDLPTLEGDPLQLRQLLQNLIGNALKYHRSDAPPHVRVYAKEGSEMVQIFVEDQGIGFDQKDAERIFQPFQRLVSRSEYEGSGIGLSICQKIVERHAGSIAAFGRPGQGTTMMITLPVHQRVISDSYE